MDANETIAAVGTGIGGAVAIIRISGPDSLAVGSRIWQGRKNPGSEDARRMLLGMTVPADGGPGEPALLVFMPGPNSYTGEDMVEVHCHGGMMCVRQTLSAALRAGARAARPGEFTLRAFLNGKMDLTQAEAVAELISARSEMALRLAERQVAGRLGEKVREIRNALVDVLAEVESRMDFDDEHLDWLGPEQLALKVNHAGAMMQELIGSGNDGMVLREGVRIVIAGRPNSGKSSLLNRLLGFDRAIVTELPGTTRDTVEEPARLRDIPVRLIDTAGIREADDLIEGIGIERSLESLKLAQVVFWLLDAADPDPDQEVSVMRQHLTAHTERVIAVWNKMDLHGEKILPETDLPTAHLSVRTGSGMESLLDLLELAVWRTARHDEPEVAVNGRHLRLLEQAVNGLNESEDRIIAEDWDLAAVHLREAVAALGDVLGIAPDPDILETIFSNFCIGK